VGKADFQIKYLFGQNQNSDLFYMIKAECSDPYQKAIPADHGPDLRGPRVSKWIALTACFFITGVSSEIFGTAHCVRVL
jgi:hypothetical protein